MNFDLNIDNYTINELEDIFELPPSYNKETIQHKASNLRNNILSNTTIEHSVKTNTLLFLSKVKDVLISNKQNKHGIINLSKPIEQSQDINNITHNSNNNKFIDNYTNNHPDFYFKKKSNPITFKDRIQNVNIDTRFRKNYYTTLSSDFHINLPMKLSNVVSMELSAIEFPPTTFYNISKILGNNYMWLRAGSNDNNDLENKLILLPDGNYSPQDAINLLNGILESDVNTTYIQYIYFSVNAIESSGSGSNQVIASVKESYPYSIPFNFTIDLQADIHGNPDDNTPLPLKLGWTYGFRNGLYTNNSAYLSEGVVNFNGARYIFLVINDYNNANNTFFSAFNESILNKDILGRISIQSSSIADLTQSNISLVTTPRQYNGPVDIEKLNIQLLDEYGRILNLNNMDFSFCLTFISNIVENMEE